MIDYTPHHQYTEVLDRPEQANIYINNESIISITGTGFGNTPVYLAQLEAETTSFSFDAPDGWYVRTASSDGYASGTFVMEGAADNAEWLDDPSIMIGFSNVRK